MRKNILLISIFISVCFATKTIAQTNIFSKIYSNSSYWMEGKSFVQTINNTYMVAAGGGFLFQLDSAGTLLWANQIGLPNQTFNHIIETKDSNYVLVGDNYNTSSSTSTIICVKVNPLGDTIWSKEFTQSADSYSFSVIETYDNGFVITGNLSFPSPPYSKILVIKIDSMGTSQWSKTILGGNWENYSYDIKQTPDSGYVINCMVENNVSSIFEINAALIKLNSSGNVVWANKYNNLTTPINTTCVSMDITPTGIISILAILPTNDLILMKTDFSGNVIWSNSYNIWQAGGLTINTTKQPIHNTSDGGYVTLGFGGNMGQTTIIKIDSSGNIQWIKSFELQAIDVIQTSDLGYALLGSGSPGSLLNSLIGVIKIDSLGNGSVCLTNDSITYQTYSFTAAPFITTEVADGTSSNCYPSVISMPISVSSGCYQNFDDINENQLSTVSVYPNPSTSFFTFSGLQGECTIKIYDLMGKIIYFTETSEEKASINLNGKSIGIYFYRIFEKSNIISQGRISLN